MPINYERELNREQLNVVMAGDGPCLVLAGAGTGKTRTIVYRVAHLIERGIAPERILLVTFTNKAAKEMLRRVELAVGTPLKGMWGGTFHHVGSLTLRKYGSRIGIAPNYTILDEDDRKNLLQTVMSEYGIDRKRDKYFPKPDLVRALFSFAVNSVRPLDELVYEWMPKQKERLGDFIQIAARYEQSKRERQLLDFDDLLSQWLRLLQARPEVRQQLNRRFEYILVDEYQDTNRLQGAIVESLAGERKNVLVVGDDAQSIYAFRAATVENIMRFPEIFAGAKIFRLIENYRSTQKILDLANAALSGNRRQFQKELKSALPNGGAGPNAGTEKPLLAGCADLSAEARFIVSRILEFHADGETLFESAVLFRAAYHAMQVELELQKCGVPYIVRGGIRFFEQAHIKDIIAYLKVVANPRDEIAWRRILKLEPGIGDTTAALVIKHAADNSVRLSAKAQACAENVFRRIDHLRSLKRIERMVGYLLETFYSQYAGAAFENSRERLEDLAQLAIFSQTYETLDQFLADATLSEGFRGERAADTSGERGSDPKDNEYLVLSTIHQAKGLEWRRVFVIGLTDGQFPHYRSFRNREEIEEERRLFYVAVTRAKAQLFLTYPIAAASFYGTAINQPSLFLRELPPDVYQAKEEEVSDVIELESL